MKRDKCLCAGKELNALNAPDESGKRKVRAECGCARATVSSVLHVAPILWKVKLERQN